MQMHGDEIKGTELSSTFDAILQLEIKSVANVLLTMFDWHGLPAELVLHGKPCLCNHGGCVQRLFEEACVVFHTFHVAPHVSAGAYFF